MWKLGFRISFSFAFASSVDCVFFCGVRRSIEQSVRVWFVRWLSVRSGSGLQVDSAVVAVVAGFRWSRVACGHRLQVVVCCGGRGLQVESRLL